MKRFKIIPLALMLTLLAIPIFSTKPAAAGWLTDPLGDTLLAKCDITRLDVSKEEMKITLASAPYLDENNTVRLDYNVWVNTDTYDDDSTSSDEADLTWSSDFYEYLCHLTCRWSGGTWINESRIEAYRFYQTADGSATVDGHFYWNPNTENWQASDPVVDCAVISGNTIIWDVTGAIYRYDYLGTGYPIQGIATTGYGLMLNDTGPNLYMVDEFDNMCSQPTGTNTPTLPFSATSFIVSLAFLATITMVSVIIKKKR
jgi:hypothetical protein